VGLREMRKQVIGENYNMRRLMMCSSTKIIRLIKSIRIRYAGHVAYKETDEVQAWFWWGDLMKGVHLKNTLS